MGVIDAYVYFVWNYRRRYIAVVNDFSGSEKPVIFAEIPEFKGDTYRGYEIAYNSIIDQLTVRSKKEQREF